MIIDIHQLSPYLHSCRRCRMSNRAISAKVSRRLPLAVAILALALAGCNQMTAEPAPPPRPVLVTSVHYESQIPDRSFVGTIRPRIESDLGFRIAGKVSRRLVEVGSRVVTGQKLATLDETDLRLQAEQAEAEYRAATGVLAQASAAESRTNH